MYQASVPYRLKCERYPSPWLIVPALPHSYLPQVTYHTGQPSHPNRRKFAQRDNCSDRRTLVCHSQAATARAGRQTGGEAGDWACTLRPLSWSRQACVLCVSQQGHTVRHVSGPSRHKQMFSWVLLFRLPCNCFPSGPACGTRCQVVLWHGVMEGWRDRVYDQSASPLEAVLWRLSIFLVLHVA